MKFSHIFLLASGSLVAAQDSSTGGGLLSSITNAGAQDVLDSQNRTANSNLRFHHLERHERAKYDMISRLLDLAY